MYKLDRSINKLNELKHEDIEVISIPGQKKGNISPFFAQNSYPRNPNQIVNTVQSDLRLGTKQTSKMTQALKSNDAWEARHWRECLLRHSRPDTSSKQTPEKTLKYETSKTLHVPDVIYGYMREDAEIEENSLESYHWCR